MPIFAVLIAFYMVRSLLLYGIFKHLDVSAYNHLKDVLSLVDLFLQVVLVIEITISTYRAVTSVQPDGRLRFAAPLAAGAFLAAILALSAPGTGREPFDRGILFITLLMFLLLTWMSIARISGPHRRVAEGFACYGIVAVLASIGRNYAILHRSSAGFLAASYAQTGFYLLITLYWILTIPLSRRIQENSLTASSEQPGD
jgi:hypothetical protein